ncbi:DUF1573 domain-containing protein [Cerasicoccus maritimus]|uniref:DUF1573 domain-containing protein n=1 Tax=Cerasicoccus maritimus TaxID=490089 RepID=UPI0028527F85|nr:DUF1573 domain-containing protein [Cerasicoccus maritimus]
MKHISIIFLLLAALTLRAELVFETTRVDGGTAKTGEKEFVAKFPFKNTGDTAITILQAKSSCGCTVPKLPKKTYAPGESGEIEAVFSFDARTGLQKKSISVMTDGEPKRLTLNLKITIPEVMTLKPRVLFWSLGQEPLEAKQFQVVLGEGIQADVKLVGDAPADFDVTLAPAETDMADYTITVMPKSEKATRGKFKIAAYDAEGNMIADSYAFAITRIPRSSGKALSGNSPAPQAP